MKNILRNMIEQRKTGKRCGTVSFCTANDLVIEACMQRALRDRLPVLIEATANQVNQFGGYTGMLPDDFSNFVYGIADRIGFPHEKIILGGDHLGPLTWQNEPEEIAMKKSIDLVKLFVSAGFKKIHLDTSMRLGDDPYDEPLTDEVIARRGAILYQACEDAYQEMLKINKDEERPVFIIGSEVPIPGGTREKEESINVTTAEALQNTIRVYKEAFAAEGLKDGFRNVIGIVVQPGVEFGDTEFFRYNRSNIKNLISAAQQLDGIVLEGHSTDYQPAEALKEMVEDGIAILKVGPALTFGLREGLFALDLMEKELISSEKRANFTETLERAMLEKPDNWKKYYHGDEKQQAIKRKFSFSDRCRYYLTNSEVKASMEKLFDNLNQIEIPMSMLHQYMPIQYYKVRNGHIAMKSQDLVKDWVITFVDDYHYATNN